MSTRGSASNLVDFFVAGNSKSGTSALHRFLTTHPHICMSALKEPNVFATDFCHEADVGAFTRKTLKEYHDLFRCSPDARLQGESSACYLYSEEAAKNIHAYNPDARIVAIFREPVDFLFSYHLEMLTNPISEGEVEKDFHRALQLEQERKHGKSVPDGCLVPALLHYSERVKYADHLERFYNYFDRDQVIVFIYEDFKQDNARVYKELLQFLGVDDRFLPPAFNTYNKSRKLRSKWAQHFVHDLSHGEGALSPVRAAIKSITPEPLRRSALQFAYRHLVFKPKPAVDPTLEQQLKSRFLPHVRAFGRLIGRDMVNEWGYEAIASHQPSDSPATV